MHVSDMVNKFGDALLERYNGGIFVAMFYDKEKDETWIFYSDQDEGITFTLNPPKFLSYDAYMHPIPYYRANMNGVENPFRLNPRELVAA